MFMQYVLNCFHYCMDLVYYYLEKPKTFSILGFNAPKDTATSSHWFYDFAQFSERSFSTTAKKASTNLMNDSTTNNDDKSCPFEVICRTMEFKNMFIYSMNLKHNADNKNRFHIFHDHVLDKNGLIVSLDACSLLEEMEHCVQYVLKHVLMTKKSIPILFVVHGDSISMNLYSKTMIEMVHENVNKSNYSEFSCVVKELETLYEGLEWLYNFSVTH